MKSRLESRILILELPLKYHLTMDESIPLSVLYFPSVKGRDLTRLSLKLPSGVKRIQKIY